VVLTLSVKAIVNLLDQRRHGGERGRRGNLDTSVVICNDGTNACTLTCTAGGGLTLARSAGADSYSASLWVVYV